MTWGSCSVLQLRKVGHQEHRACPRYLMKHSNQRGWKVHRGQSLLVRTNHSALPQEPMVIRIMLQVSATRNSQLERLASYLDRFCKTYILLEFCCLLLDLVKRLQVQSISIFSHHTKRGVSSPYRLWFLSHPQAKLQLHNWSMLSHLTCIQGRQEVNLFRGKSTFLRVSAPSIGDNLYFIIFLCVISENITIFLSLQHTRSYLSHA